MEEKVILGLSKKQKAQRYAIFSGLIGTNVFGMLSMLITDVIHAFIPGLIFGLLVYGIIRLIYKISWNKKLKMLHSTKYNELNQLGFTCNANLFYEGIYNDFFIRVIPTSGKLNKQAKVDYDIIQVFYELKPSDQENNKTEDVIKYSFGKLLFDDQYLSFIPLDYQNPDFKYNLDEVIRVLTIEGHKFVAKRDSRKIV